MSTEKSRLVRGSVFAANPAIRLLWPGLLLAALLGALLVALLYQIPARHPVNIGHYDAAYTQGFHDPEVAADTPVPPAYLAGSDGSVRWSRSSSFLLFPQAGLPARVTLRLRGYRPTGSPSRVEVLLNGTTSLAVFQASDMWQEQSFVINGGWFKATDFFLELRSETTILPDDGREVGVLLDSAFYEVYRGPGGLILPYPTQVAYGALAAALLWLLMGGGRWTADGGRRTVDGGRWTVDGGRWTVDGGRWTVDGGRRTLRLRSGLSAIGYRLSAIGYRLSAIALALAFLLLYRLQPPLYPYPLRWLLPGVNLVLLAALGLRLAPQLPARPLLLRVAAVAALLLWVAGLTLAAREHVTLARPSVENDFRVFALRSVQFFGSFSPTGEYTVANDGVLRADGFYNLGYPLLLWLVRPLVADNPFLAGRLVALLSGVVFLAGAWWLARLVMSEERQGENEPEAGALLALIMLAFSPLVVQYALYLGTDMPFAACVTLALALLVAARHTRGHRQVVLLGLGGAVAGSAFLVRHIGLLLLVWGWGWCMLALRREEARRRGGATRGGDGSASAHPASLRQTVGELPPPGISELLKAVLAPVGWFSLGFLLVALPQFVVNIVQTGDPLYNQQAKNAWLAVYGGIDWSRWFEVKNSIGLAELFLRDPGRFLANWWGNLSAFVGTGAEDTGEFGRAYQLRLLGFPANWLALAGLLAWLALLLRRRGSALQGGLLILVALYVAGVSIAFVLPRFFLPLAPVYAAAGASLMARLLGGLQGGQLPRAWVGALLLGVALLWGGFGIGRAYVLGGQPPAEVAVAQMLAAQTKPGDQLIARTTAGAPLVKYSAIAHLVVPYPNGDEQVALEAAQAKGIAYLLWEEALGPAPLTAAPVARGGGYALYRIVSP